MPLARTFKSLSVTTAVAISKPPKPLETQDILL
jgi:hypothetical protein